MKTKDVVGILLVFMIGVFIGWVVASQQATLESKENINVDETVSQQSKSNYLSAQILSRRGSINLTRESKVGPSNNKAKSFSFAVNNNEGGECKQIGKWDKITKTCVLKKNVSDTIQIGSPGMTLDCNNFSIIPAPDTNGVVVPAGNDGVTIKNCTITQSGSWSVAISVLSNNTVIDSNIITDNWTGIELIANSNNSITNNTFDGPWGWHVYAWNSTGNTFNSNTFNEGGLGIYLDSSDGNELLNNKLINIGFAGMNIWSSNTEVRNNSIENVRFPIRNYGNQNIISGNTVSGGQWGIDGAGNGSEIVNNDISNQFYIGIGVSGEGNTVADNHIHDSAGIHITSFPANEWGDPEVESSGNIVENNLIENGLSNGGEYNGAGVRIVNDGDYPLGRDNIVRGNTILSMAYGGILLRGTGDNNSIENNVVRDNGGVGIRIENSGGNYFFLNDVFGNTDTQVYSDNNVFVDSNGDSGNKELGNYWGTDCPSGSYFIPGTHSNSSGVLDRKPFGYPVAELGYVPDKSDRPCLK